ncbi:MAG: HDOD domain-containing protein [Armatimonadota bacterium]|nr:HDOD domain-containing protein [Armatimonadota bacterium]MDW8104016.1 HDOD domain-containing protein [Armatimonadota bacterium]
MNRPLQVSSYRAAVGRHRLEEAIQESIDRLPPLPAVVSRVMELTNDPNCTAQDLQKVIGMDEVLSSKVLRLVNSARYGFPKRISTLSHAVILLGFETIRNLAIGAATVRLLLRDGAASPVNRQQFWEHSLETGLAASVLAKHLRKDLILREEMFLAGLLHDLGVLFLSQTFPEAYREVLQQCSSLEEAQAAESQVFGMTHGEVGARMAERWNLPPVFAEVMLHHHAPRAESPFFLQTAAVYLGDRLSYSLGNQAEDASLPSLQADLQQTFLLDESTWQWCRREVEMQMDAARDFLHILQSP